MFYFITGYMPNQKWCDIKEKSYGADKGIKLICNLLYSKNILVGVLVWESHLMKVTSPSHRLFNLVSKVFCLDLN